MPSSLLVILYVPDTIFKSSVLFIPFLYPALIFNVPFPLNVKSAFE